MATEQVCLQRHWEYASACQQVWDEEAKEAQRQLEILTCRLEFENSGLRAQLAIVRSAGSKETAEQKIDLARAQERISALQLEKSELKAAVFAAKKDVELLTMEVVKYKHSDQQFRELIEAKKSLERNNNSLEFDLENAKKVGDRQILSVTSAKAADKKYQDEISDLKAQLIRQTNAAKKSQLAMQRTLDEQQSRLQVLCNKVQAAKGTTTTETNVDARPKTKPNRKGGEKQTSENVPFMSSPMKSPAKKTKNEVQQKQSGIPVLSLTPFLKRTIAITGDSENLNAHPNDHQVAKSMIDTEIRISEAAIGVDKDRLEAQQEKTQPRRISFAVTTDDKNKCNENPTMQPKKGVDAFIDDKDELPGKKRKRRLDKSTARAKIFDEADLLITPASKNQAPHINFGKTPQQFSPVKIRDDKFNAIRGAFKLNRTNKP